MASNFQSSFIPKEPVVTEQVFKKKKAGFLGVLAVSLFVSSIVIAGGMYVYKGIIKRDIASLQTELAEAEKNIDKQTISEMSKFSKKLELVRTLVQKHQVVSGFLDTLASSTVSSVQFISFSYGDIEQGKLTVTLQGKAASYSSIAQQENVFSQNPYFTSMAFSNLTLVEGGLVAFDLAIGVDPRIAAYRP